MRSVTPQKANLKKFTKQNSESLKIKKQNKSQSKDTRTTSSIKNK
jgi:hypothetical protein